MSYSEDLAAADRWEKARIACLIAAVALSVVGAFFEVHWLHVPRAVLWALGGIAAVKEGRAVKRLGRDPDACYLRAALFFLVAVGCFAFLK